MECSGTARKMGGGGGKSRLWEQQIKERKEKEKCTQGQSIRDQSESVHTSLDLHHDNNREAVSVKQIQLNFSYHILEIKYLE